MSNKIATVKSPEPDVPAAMRAGAFDADAFFLALDAVRIARRKNWKQVAQEAGISASTLTRMAQGKRPDVDSLAAIAAWSGLSVDDYVRGKVPKAPQEPLAMISTYLRSDRHLSPQAALALDAVIKATYERLRGT
ncbi:helix-turn-helix domain-containing protein [Sorangium sp. So ce363]|uniref:helix-turn-helix domain-containing protein n=1 Tax=Sorangium sp. So ce363 TaxID=3133304 RepID=UPI003F634FD6